MAVLTILKLGDPVLRSPSSPVEVFDDALRTLASDMLETMEGIGVGLAAPQVGVPRRMFVYNDGEESGAVVNPQIAWSSDELVDYEEGCLSIPGIYAPVTRPERIRVRGADLHGEPLEREVDGFLARIWQHEIDHLDGILFIDRLAPDVRKHVMAALADQDFGMSPPPRPAAPAAGDPAL